MEIRGDGHIDDNGPVLTDQEASKRCFGSLLTWRLLFTVIKVRDGKWVSQNYQQLASGNFAKHIEISSSFSTSALRESFWGGENVNTLLVDMILRARSKAHERINYEHLVYL